MTDKLFWQEPYQTVLHTQVTKVTGPTVQLEKTIFYAFSGGQESDAGSIAGMNVLEARKNGLEIEYQLKEDHGLSPGTAVTVEIDWSRRYRLMRLHFAAELLLELVYRSFPGIEKIGAHIAEDKARLDFAMNENISSHFLTLSRQAREIIDKNIPIISAYADETNQRRYWEVPGFAKVACGGTHLKTTGEVGNFRLKRKNIGKGKERIEIYLEI